MKIEGERHVRRAMVIASIAATIAAVGAFATAHSATPLSAPPAVLDTTVPRMPLDLGIGERLILVVGGVYASEGEAAQANAALHFGELQGYYVVPVSQFRGLSGALPSSGPWVLATAFRTKTGADGFVQLAKAAGAPAFVTPRVVSLGGTFAGLGQEAAPDGTGPLTHPVPASEPR